MKSNTNPPLIFNLPTIGLNIKIYFYYWLCIALSILIGISLRIIYTPHYSYKLSFISGIHFIKNRIIFLSFTLNLLFIIWIIYIFFSNTQIKSLFDKSIIKFLENIRCGFFFSNLMLLVCYAMLKNQLFLPLRKATDIELSITTLEFIVSGAMLNHLYYICNKILKKKINIELMTYFCYIIKSLLSHNVCCLLWTAWIDFSIQSLVLAFIISCLYVIVIQLCSIDYIMLILLDKNQNTENSIDILYIANQ